VRKELDIKGQKRRRRRKRRRQFTLAGVIQVGARQC
jgi:hypothetical protein